MQARSFLVCAGAIIVAGVFSACLGPGTSPSNHGDPSAATGGNMTGGNGGSSPGSGGDNTATGAAAGSDTDSSGGSPAAGGDAGTGGAGPDPNFHVFLLIGQSNMEGGPSPEAEDLEENPRVQVLAHSNCAATSRTYGQWYTARPPLHSCYMGVGPGDRFGKIVAEAYPEATIGLVPCAIAGVDIDFFRKGVVSSRRGEFSIPPDNQREGAYEWVIERARLAQQSGVIRSILFHQGESDTGQAVWVNKVAEIVADLRADLGIGNVPFLAGELLSSGCCGSHNPLVSQLPGQIENAHVISASDLTGYDSAHFDLASQRILGERYATKFLEVTDL